MHTQRCNPFTLCVTGLAFLLGGCAAMTSDGEPAVLRLEGVATYRERMLLPPESTLEVVVEDISRADAPAEVLGLATVHLPGAPPIRFAVEYPAARILPGHRYGVRARIEHQGRLLFVTDTFNPLPSAGGAPLELRLVRVGADATTSTATLQNTYWKLLEADGKTIVTSAGQREAHMILQLPGEGELRVTGFGGCNGLGGNYTLEADRLQFSRMISTMMACEHGMDTEQAFHRALQEARRWLIRGEQLELLDGDARRVARFESVYLR